MKIKSLFFILALLFISNAAQAQGKWEKLGMRTVNYSLDRDVIPVGAHEGAYTKLRVIVRGGAINMHRMVITYMNGEQQEIELRHNFTKQSASREIDLAGNKRLIKSVTFVYDTKNLARRKAVVVLYGRH